jgi:hypothetical protein
MDEANAVEQRPLRAKPNGAFGGEGEVIGFARLDGRHRSLPVKNVRFVQTKLKAIEIVTKKVHWAR